METSASALLLLLLVETSDVRKFPNLGLADLPAERAPPELGSAWWSPRSSFSPQRAAKKARYVPERRVPMRARERQTRQLGPPRPTLPPPPFRRLRSRPSWVGSSGSGSRSSCCSAYCSSTTHSRRRPHSQTSARSLSRYIRPRAPHSSRRASHGSESPNGTRRPSSEDRSFCRRWTRGEKDDRRRRRRERVCGRTRRGRWKRRRRCWKGASWPKTRWLFRPFDDDSSSSTIQCAAFSEPTRSLYRSSRQS